MKKVFLSAVALMIAAVGFSQVTDTNGNSSPAPQAATVLGGTSLTGNAAEAIQNGNDNRVRVRQAGEVADGRNRFIGTRHVKGNQESPPEGL